MATDRSVFSDKARFADDTRRRFLSEIVARVPLDRIVEVHLFTPIRQSGVETGVAIIAAARPEEAPQIELPNVEPVEEPSGEACDPTEDAARDEPESAAPVEVPNEPATEASLDELMDPISEDEAAAEEEADAPPPVRHTIFTARYRLTIKGVERGKWSCDVVEEADAPLATIDAVVRGVQRRAGDSAEPDRLGTEAVARAIDHSTPSPTP